MECLKIRCTSGVGLEERRGVWVDAVSLTVGIGPVGHGAVKLRMPFSCVFQLQ